MHLRFPRTQGGRFGNASRAALFAVLMLFIGPLVSQSLPMDHTPAMPGMNMPMAGHAGMQHHGGGDPHPAWERCGYCSLFLHCPALPQTLAFVGATAPPLAPAPTNAVLQGHNSTHRFRGALPRAPPSTLG